MHVLHHPRFYLIARFVRLGDWGVAYNFVGNMVACCLLLALLLSGAHNRPGGPAWRAWLRCREFALTVLTLQTHALAMPAVLFATPPAAWHRLPTFLYFHSAMRAPLWDMCINTLIDDMMHVRKAGRAESERSNLEIWGSVLRTYVLIICLPACLTSPTR